MFLSAIGSMITYFQTEVVYEYTAIAYSFYHSFYISVFTVYYTSGAAAGSNNTAIIATCSAAAVVVEF